MSRYGFESEETIRQRAAAAKHQKQQEAQRKEAAQKEAVDRHVRSLDYKVRDIMGDFNGRKNIRTDGFDGDKSGWTDGSTSIYVTDKGDGNFGLQIRTDDSVYKSGGGLTSPQHQ